MKSARDFRTKSLKPNERNSASRLGRIQFSSEFSNSCRFEKSCGGSLTTRARQSDCKEFKSRSNSPNFNLTQNTLKESNMFSTFSDGMNSNTPTSKFLPRTQAKSFAPCLSNRNRPASSLNLSKEIAITKKPKEVTRTNREISKENVIQTHSTGLKLKKNTKNQVTKRRSDNQKTTKTSPISATKLKPKDNQHTKTSSSKSSIQSSRKIRTALILREQQLKQALDESRSKEASTEEPSRNSIDQPQLLDTSFNQTFRPYDSSFTHNIQHEERVSLKEEKRSGSNDRKVAVRSLKNSVLAKLAFRELHKSTLDSLLAPMKSSSNHDSFILDRQDPTPDFGHPEICENNKKFIPESESYCKESLSLTNLLSSSEDKILNSPSSEQISTDQEIHIEEKLRSSNGLDEFSNSLEDKINHNQFTLDISDGFNILKPIKVEESDLEEEFITKEESYSSLFVQEVAFSACIPDGSIAAPALRSIGSNISHQSAETNCLLHNSSPASCTSDNPCIQTTETEELEDLKNENNTLNILKRAFSEAAETKRVLEESQDSINRSMERHSSLESRFDYEDLIRLQTINPDLIGKMSFPDMLGSFANCTPESGKFMFTEESHSLDKAVQTDINYEEELIVKILKTLSKDNVLKGFKLLGGFARYLESHGEH